MSNQLTKPYNDGNGSSETSYAPQSGWMSRWSKMPFKQGSLVAPHSQTFCIEEGLDHKQKRLRRSLNVSSDILKSSKDIGAQSFRKEGSNYSPFGFRGHSRNVDNLVGLASDMPPVPNTAENHKRVMVFGRNFSDDNARCSLQNVRICATVDSFGNSDGGRPLFSQTTTHHFFFAKRNGMNLPREHQAVRESRGGVRIQPLWSSTESEKDNFGDAATTGADNSQELSVEADAMDVDAVSNKKHFFGVLLSPLDKSTSKDDLRSKSLISNIPDINSMDDDDDMEPSSTSRTLSLGVEHLTYCFEQPLGSKLTPQNKECTVPEPSSTWVRRLKLGASDMGESALTMNLKSKNAIFQSSWIQRWANPGQSEPNSSKLPVDEKKQFPSIAAMALMGKSMNGFRTCKFSKRGPLVVWSSEDH